MANLVEKRYGEALFEVALSANKIDSLEEELEGVLFIIDSNVEFLDYLTHPNVLFEDKIKLIEDSFKESIGDELMGLMVLLIKKGRQAYLTGVLQTALESIHTHKGQLKAYVHSPFELSNEDKKKIKEKLEADTKKEINLVCKTNPKLIGGLIIRINDRVIDSTIKGGLHRLSRELMKVEL